MFPRNYKIKLNDCRQVITSANLYPKTVRALKLFIVKKLNHPHDSKEGKFVNRANAVEKKASQKMKLNLSKNTLINYEST